MRGSPGREGVNALHIGMALLVVMFLLVGVWYVWLMDDTDKGLSLTIVPDKGSYTPDEQLLMSFVLQNDGNAPIQVSELWPAATLLCTLVNSSGEVILQRPMSIIGFPDQPVSLAPGQNHTWGTDIRTLFSYDFPVGAYDLNATYENKQENCTRYYSPTISFSIEALPEPMTLVSFAAQNGNVTITCEVADEAPEQTQGLMGRTELADDAGMLFVFDPAREVQFWMKNTLIPLDIIFIAENGTVVKVYEAAVETGVPDIDLTRYPSGEPVIWVVEVNQGLSAQYGIGPGVLVQVEYVEP